MGGHEIPYPILLYDGDCAFCNASVQFVLRHDRRGTLRFAAIESALGRKVKEGHSELKDIDSLIWFEPDHAVGGKEIYVKSAAAFQILRYLGGWWRLGLMAKVAPSLLIDWCYDMFARHRHRFLRRAEACIVVPPEEKHRFMW